MGNTRRLLGSWILLDEATGEQMVTRNLGEWIAERHVTCSVQCCSRKCNRSFVDIRLDTLPQNIL